MEKRIRLTPFLENVQSRQTGLVKCPGKSVFLYWLLGDDMSGVEDKPAISVDKAIKEQD